MTALSHKRNLDDWLSPILVKELRQGMRARSFVISFVLIQVFLVLLVVGNVAAQDDRSALDFQDHFFWIIVGFTLLGLMPLRGLVAISSEIKNHTIETIMLTRLTAWRVVFGKWSALFAQSLLLVSAVLPFVVLRYFIGGDDVVSDFEWILLMLWLSGMLIAISIAVSALGNVVIRIIILIAVAVIALSGAGEMFSPSYSRLEFGEALGWLVIFGFFVPALLFELTASGIAPVSENHAIRRRLFALLFFLSACLMEWLAKSDFHEGVAAPLIVLIGICYYDLSEKPRLLARMVRSLTHRNPVGRVAAFFLLPGWPSALVFSLIIIPAAMGVFYYFVPPDAKYGWLLPINAIMGSILTPILICHLFWPKMKHVLLMVVLYNVILMGLTAILDGFASLMHSQINQALEMFPGLPVLFVDVDEDRIKDHMLGYLYGNSVTLVFVVGILLAGCRDYYRELMAIFRGSGNSTAPMEVKTAEGTT